MTALSDRGIFWWSDQAIPPNQFAPEENVAGLLTISDTGRINIDLDGVLPSASGRFSAMEQGKVLHGRSITGLLKSDNRYVLATDLYRNGGTLRTAGLTTEKYNALYCLISTTLISPKRQVRAIVFDLAGYEEWLWIGRFTSKYTSRSFTIKHLTKPDLRFRSAAGKLLVRRYITFNQDWNPGSQGTELRERAQLRYSPSMALSNSSAVEKYVPLR